MVLCVGFRCVMIFVAHVKNQPSEKNAQKKKHRVGKVRWPSPERACALGVH